VNGLSGAWQRIVDRTRSLFASESAERLVLAGGTLGGVLLLGAFLNAIFAAVGVVVILLVLFFWLVTRSSGDSD
jgi:uncharacterized membrane protein